MIELLRKTPHIYISYKYINCFNIYNLYINDKVYKGVIIYHGNDYSFLYIYKGKFYVLNKKLKFHPIKYKNKYLIPINKNLSIRYFISEVLNYNELYFFKIGD